MGFETGRLLVVVCLVIPLAARAEELSGTQQREPSAGPTERADQLVSTALQASLLTGVGYAREWLASDDFKSVAQSARGQLTLAQVLRARSDDAGWQETVGKIITQVRAQQEAARSGDRNACRAALDALEEAVRAVDRVPRTGVPLPPQRAQGGLRPLMLVMDGIRADAKVALLNGRTADAKKAAHVLAELGRVVSMSRSGEQRSEREWSEMSQGFVEAAQSMAQSPVEDAPAVRQLLREVSQRCDACHEGG